MNLYLSSGPIERHARWRAQYFECGPTSNIDTDIAIKLGWQQTFSAHMSWTELKALHAFLAAELDAHQCELDDLHGQALRHADSLIGPLVTVDLP